MIAQAIIFCDKAKHLAAVHKLPQTRWPEFVQWIAQADRPPHVVL